MGGIIGRPVCAQGYGGQAKEASVPLGLDGNADRFRAGLACRRERGKHERSIYVVLFAIPSAVFSLVTASVVFPLVTADTKH